MQEESRQLAKEQAAFCRVFANANRILILWSLTGGEKSVSDIAAALGGSLQSTSQHLGLMKACGILKTRREGQNIYYRIAEGDPPHKCQLVAAAHQKLALLE